MYPVVEECEGFNVCSVPAVKGRPQKYMADFGSKALCRTPFRLSFEQAKQEGDAVMRQVKDRLGRQWDAGRQARHATEPHANPSSTDVSEQAPKKMRALNARTDSRMHALQAHLQQLSTAAVGSGGIAGASGGTAAAAVVVPPLLPPPAAAAAGGGTAAGTPHIGCLVNLLTRYHGGFPGACILLGSRIGSGSFADVYQGTLVAMNGMQISNPQGYAHVAAAAAAAALPADQHYAVKVFRSSRPGTPGDVLQKSLKQELRALQRLRFHVNAVQLLAEGEVLPAPDARTQPAGSSRGSQPGRSSSKGKRDQRDPYCAVLESCPRSLKDVLRHGPCSEATAKYVAAAVVRLLAYCQGGELDCVIVHRDLKPANILIRSDNTIAVADFGACHIVELSQVAAAVGAAALDGSTAADASDDQQQSQQQQHPSSAPNPAAVAAALAVQMHDGIGTPFYAAPEVYGVGAACCTAADPAAGTAAAAAAMAGQQAPSLPEGNGGGSSSSPQRSYDASVDVFALGVVVVEMLLGCLAGASQAGPPRSAEQVQLWEQRLAGLVDGQVPLPAGVHVSAAALQFIGCCCGVGREREAAAAQGDARRLSPEQLLAAAWLQQD